MLIYTGGGYGGFLAGVPARNLSTEEVKQYGGETFLLNTKLYEQVKVEKLSAKMARGGSENKLAQPANENKDSEE